MTDYDQLAQIAEDAGHPEVAERLRAAGPTPEAEAAFEEWLSDPANRERWYTALAEARDRLSPAPGSGEKGRGE